MEPIAIAFSRLAASPFFSLATGFLLGLAGGFGHCAAMCGGFTLAFARVRGLSARSGWLDRLIFHGGRVTMYGLIATVLLLVGTGSELAAPRFRAIWQAGLALVLLVIAAHLMFPMAIRARTGFIDRTAGAAGRLIRRAFQHFWQKGPLAIFAAGLSWGLIPCAFSWGVILGAAGQRPANAIAGLLGFGLGTMLPLTIAELGVGAISTTQRAAMRNLAAILIAAFGSIQLVQAVTLLRDPAAETHGHHHRINPPGVDSTPAAPHSH